MIEFWKTDSGFGFGTLKNLRRDLGFSHACGGGPKGHTPPCTEMGRWKVHRKSRRHHYGWLRSTIPPAKVRVLHAPAMTAFHVHPHANYGTWVSDPGRNWAKVVGLGLQLGLIGYGFRPGY